MKLSFNNPLVDFLNTTADFIVLNIIFLISCIPVVTIGPAVAALYQVLLRESRGEHGYLVKKYIQHFKEMFWQGSFTFVTFAATLLITSFAFIFWKALDGVTAIIITVLTLLLCIAIICGLMYVFPLMARFKNSFLHTIKNAYLLSLTNLKYTSLLLLLHIFVFGLIYLFPAVRVFMIIVGFSFFAYCMSFIFTRVFKGYEPIENVEEI